MGIASVSELASFLSEQADWFAVGELGEQAGIQGSTELKQLAAELTASVAAEQGLDFEGMPETSQLAGIAKTFTKAVGWLGKTSAKVLAKLTANVALIATLGGIYVAYSWLTAEEQVQHETERQLGETVRAAIANMSPTDKQKVLQSYMASRAGTGLTTKHVVLAGLAVVAFAIAWKWFGGGRR